MNTDRKSLKGPYRDLVLKIGTLFATGHDIFVEKKTLRMVFSLKNPVNRQFCRENVNIRVPGMKVWCI